MPKRRPIAENLFACLDPGQEALLAGRHRETGALVFPIPENDPAYTPHTLRRDGLLWSFTVQRFRPKTPPYAGPAEFTPYALGYVELPGELIVESRLTGIPFESLCVGLKLRLTTEPITLHGEVEPRLSYAFTAAEAAS